MCSAHLEQQLLSRATVLNWSSIPFFMNHMMLGMSTQSFWFPRPDYLDKDWNSGETLFIRWWGCVYVFDDLIWLLSCWIVLSHRSYYHLFEVLNAVDTLLVMKSHDCAPYVLIIPIRNLHMWGDCEAWWILNYNNWVWLFLYLVIINLYQGDFAQELKGPWNLKSLIDGKWWGRPTSLELEGQGINQIWMDNKLSWSPTWHGMDKLSWFADILCEAHLQEVGLTLNQETMTLQNPTILDLI